MFTFLHAACGGNDKTRTTREFATDEWKEVRLDSNSGFNPDITASLIDMQLEPESFDAAYTAHSLERLYAHEVGTALANLYAALKPEGYLVLMCADVQAACALVAEDKLLEPAYESPAGPVAPIDILYGFRPALAAGHKHLACKCGFTTRALMGTLAQAGFGSVWSARNPEAFSILTIASKEERSEDFMREIAARHFA